MARLLVGLGCALAPGCAPPAPPPPVETVRELRTFLPENFRSCDPVEVGDMHSLEVASQIFEGLLRYRPYDPERGLELEAGMAERWEVSDDGRVYRFFLRPGVVFHDDPCFPGGRGRAVTAADVEYSITRFLQHNQDADSALVLEFLEGARAFRAGRADRIHGVRVEGARTISFHLTRPWAGFPSSLALGMGWAVPREAVEKYGPQFGKHPVGTGPFRWAGWDPTSHMLLVRHERYWERDAQGRPLPYLDQVRLMVNPADRGLQAMLDGTQDICLGLPDSVREYAGPGWRDPGLRGLRVERSNSLGLAFNLDRPTPYARERRVRRALAHAIPYDRVGAFIRTHSLVPPGYPEFDPARRGPDFDLARARALLAEAGHPGGSGLPPLTLQIPAHEEGKYQPLVEIWKGLGITLTVRVVSTGQHWEQVERGEPAFFRWGFQPAGEPVETLYAQFWSRAARRFGYRNPAYDRVFEELLGESDPARRRALCRQLEDLLAEDCLLLLLRRDSWKETVQPWVESYEPSVNPFGLRFFRVVRLGSRG